MRENTNCFLPALPSEELEAMSKVLSDNKMVKHVFVDDGTMSVTSGLATTEALLAIDSRATAEYLLVMLTPAYIDFGQNCIERLMQAADDADASIVYADYYSFADGKKTPHPLIDCQEGCIRDDFDFGKFVLVRASVLHEWSRLQHADSMLDYAAWYSFRLFAGRTGRILHLNEYLYTGREVDLRTSGEKQFDYVSPANRAVQIEMEKVATAHLGCLGALVDTNYSHQPDFDEQQFDVEASVVIPVYNREKTIADAVKSALSQKTTFKYNVIVVENHSTDGTHAILEKIASADNRLKVIVPERTDLGIGGCWNEAINSVLCGKFAVQLDSDDLYSSESTLQKMVSAFRSQRAAMVIGAYRMCDFKLNTLPPGVIDHKEWTEANGCNNALRINGLGAPRAFFTPLARQIQFPNTSYGEDYAMGLRFSRSYRIGRLFEPLYLCRRWGGNSDSNLSQEKINANNYYKDKLRTIEIAARRQQAMGKADSLVDNELSRFLTRQLDLWPEARARYKAMHDVLLREPAGDDMSVVVLKAQYNPARIVSTGAKIDKKTIEKRPCFLCAKNRPAEQMVKSFDDRFQILVNPYPILPVHFTVPAKTHRRQEILDNYAELHRLLESFPDMMFFYNGPRCGASAPDHMHFQGGTSGLLPLQKAWGRLSRNLQPVVSEANGDGIFVISDYPCNAFVIRSHSERTDSMLFHLLYKALDAQRPVTDGKTADALGYEPMMNIVSWRRDDEFLSVVFPRRKHRPDCYFAEDSSRLTVSPGALDMAGLFITPLRDDFEKITYSRMVAILKEMAISDDDMHKITEQLINEGEHLSKHGSEHADLPKKEPGVTVGIVSAARIHFLLNGSYTAKGETVSGAQTAELSGGAIMWNGNAYTQLLFQPVGSGASFTLDDVVIGVNFHWERKEAQTFLGALRLIVDADKIYAINELPVENYLESVISSEMKATAGIELLKAHAVISRSWLLSQMERRRHQQTAQNAFFSMTRTKEEAIRWYGRDDHTLFDVCADDHCQRYQGITKETTPAVSEAVRQTRGQILMYDGDICDARFSKCCGGVTEEYQYCWENIRKPYLTAVRDNATGTMPADLSVEANAEKWIREAPDSFCNTTDKRILSQVLNDFDQETTDFYRWTVEYTQQRIAELLSEKLKVDFGNILDLVPVERGRSGRLSKMKIVGTKQTLIIGKELEIRRALSESHLYSSAFVVDRLDVDANGVPQRFKIIGAGWGHGVGLCQIGAAVMGENGYKYDSILKHYYKDADIKKIYK